MMIGLDTLWVIIVLGAGGGGMMSALVGYYSTNEPFNNRKFAAGIIRGFISGMLVFLTTVSSQPLVLEIGDLQFTFLDLLTRAPSLALLIAFFVGYTGDSIMNKISKVLNTNTVPNTTGTRT